MSIGSKTKILLLTSLANNHCRATSKDGRVASDRCFVKGERRGPFRYHTSTPSRSGTRRSVVWVLLIWLEMRWRVFEIWMFVLIQIFRRFLYVGHVDLEIKVAVVPGIICCWEAKA